MQKITPFLWYDGQAEEATNFYLSVFKNSKLLSMHRVNSNDSNLGVVTSTSFEIDGQQFMALNGGPQFKFTPAISFFVGCEDQQEIDELWDKLTADGGREDRCGWLTDKFGVSWQIIPKTLGQLLYNQDPAKAQKTMQAMLQMKKLDIAALKAAGQ